ncbi:hypothetical protein BB397_07770 [Helicobacter pylori]|nr:hypothetical protein BB397_07770 [Helicobacter pylori]
MLFLGLREAGNNRFYPISPTPIKLLSLPTKTNFSRLEICFLKPFYQKHRCFHGYFKSGFNTS